MSRPQLHSGAGAAAPLLVWILVPVVGSDDPNIAFYGDFEQGRPEFERAFSVLGHEWFWQPVSMRDYREVIDRILAESAPRTPIFFNLCDGDEINGPPGISVIRHLDARGATYTGSDEGFFDITTSKIVMKEAFDRMGVPTSPWRVLPRAGEPIDGIFDDIGRPVIVKPAVAAGSMGITCKSVVHTEDELTEQLRRIEEGYRGWNLTDGGVLGERFVAGREFTTFIIGSHDAPELRVVYSPVERVFHKKLPATERFLSFDRLWEFHENEGPMQDGKDFWTYQPTPARLAKRICDVSWAAYAAVGGTGYGRVDLRMDQATRELYVLEVNAQCGLSEDENYTSIGAILRFAGASYARAVQEILDAALHRASAAPSRGVPRPASRLAS
jgi:D-alanine-D-alanine ligase